MRFFLDTEFIENGETIDLLSIALVAQDGRELYAQFPGAKLDKASDWVARNVFPHLGHFDMGKQRRSCTVAKNGEFDRGDLKCKDPSCPWMRRHYVAEAIKDFCGDVPEFWTYYGAYDWVALCQLFGDMSQLPRGWPMFAYDLRQWLNHQGLGVSQPDDAPHNALEDARWLARTYERYGPGITVLAESHP